MNINESASGAARFLRSPLLRPFNDVDAIEDLLSQVNPAWSLTRIRAPVVEIRDETPDVKTFVLRPNRLWPGSAAGQHVTIEVDVDGVRRHRTFTIASAPSGSRTIELTIKRHPHGLVTRWLHEQARAGDVWTLSRPAGSFVLPEALPDRILMLSAGSGITPVMSMLRDLSGRNPSARIDFIHACRTPQDAIFAGELTRLATRMPNLRYHLHCDSQDGLLTIDRLLQIAPDALAAEALVCGPQAFMDLVRDHWTREGATARLHFESFGGPIRMPAVAGAPVEIRASRSERAFAATGTQPLLQDAEGAGLSPKYGCRIGICQTCKCRKQSGTVENLLTGKVSSEPGEMIQLCISAARSDVVLEL